MNREQQQQSPIPAFGLSQPRDMALFLCLFFVLCVSFVVLRVFAVGACIVGWQSVMLSAEAQVAFWSGTRLKPQEL
jgi:hypothetical protein